MDASSKFAYVTNRDAATVSAYTINASTGALISVDANPSSTVVDNFPSGKTPMSVVTVGVIE